MKWISVNEGVPPNNSFADENGYVMVCLRKDRQWGYPTRVGFTKWYRVTKDKHTHWMKIPPCPIELQNDAVSDTTGSASSNDAGNQINQTK